MREKLEQWRRENFKCFLGMTYTIGAGSTGLESMLDTAM